MRRVGVGISRALIASALAFALATAAEAVEPEIGTPAPETSAAPAVPPPAVPPKAAKTEQPAKDDYYTRRARSLLEAERAAAVAAHPLAARHPGMDVVVCEAGCTAGKGASIVFLRPKAVPAEATGGLVSERREGQMVPTSDTTADAVTGDATCVAGCYDRTASTDVPSEETDADPWYPSTPPAPLPPRDKLSPIR